MDKVRAEEPEPGVFGSLDPESVPNEKKGARAEAAPKKKGAGAAKNMRLLYQLLED